MKNNYLSSMKPFFAYSLRQRPAASAIVEGNDEHSNIKGRVDFYKTNIGTLVSAEVFGLPYSKGECDRPVFGFHVHEGGSCTGNEADQFADTLSHYNPNGCPHPQHSGDLPPLFGNHGYAFSVFLTDRFDIKEIIGKTVVIHSKPDDFTTQPAGNSGEKIACGAIMSMSAQR